MRPSASSSHCVLRPRLHWKDEGRKGGPMAIGRGAPNAYRTEFVSSSHQTTLTMMNCRCMVLLAVFLLATVVLAEGEIWEEDEKEVLIRSERGAKNSKDPCRYVKGPWSDCDTKTNTRSRMLTLKKKDGTVSANCEPTKTIQKKCKKACRYEKGAWSACSAQNEMVRTDTLKEKSDPSCEQKRVTTKKCKNNKTNRPNKAQKSSNVGGNRRNRQ
ncbi:PTN/MK heparin-Hypothetical protein protein family, C-terminal domain [Nesidiocoris tenuis]|uniref:Pleiotrophin/Midkine C-terminal domain-containing protein n=1 Tax=Nesidiocoris tenuis TaxID=355587 RepID=A0ABN7B772_9HEMI|nr:PTN/MK heparin-Hypothetical protein protein family, C-terminal domain [Nesidiocoris tenuis]